MYPPSLKECKKQEEDEHLRNEAEDCTDAGNDTVVDKSAEPFRCARFLKQIAYKDGNTGNPYAVICGIEARQSLFSSKLNCVEIKSLQQCRQHSSLRRASAEIDVNSKRFFFFIARVSSSSTSMVAVSSLEEALYL